MNILSYFAFKQTNRKKGKFLLKYPFKGNALTCLLETHVCIFFVCNLRVHMLVKKRVIFQNIFKENCYKQKREVIVKRVEKLDFFLIKKKGKKSFFESESISDVSYKKRVKLI